MDASRNFDLKGRSAFVTGATRGIGAAIAIALRGAGAEVHVHGETMSAATRVAQEIEGTPWACDLVNPDSVSMMVEKFVESGERLDILVNNAGVEIPSMSQSFDRSVFEEVFSVNVFAPAQLVSAFAPLLMRSVNGSIVNVSSIHDRVPSYGNGAYAASKAALRMLTETMSIELGPRGVRVNAIAPGAIETDINRSVLDEIGRDSFASWIPLGAVGKPDDVGGVAVFLASDASRYVSGATVVVDGAYSHHLVRYRTDHPLERGRQ